MDGGQQQETTPVRSEPVMGSGGDAARIESHTKQHLNENEFEGKQIAIILMQNYFIWLKVKYNGKKTTRTRINMKIREDEGAGGLIERPRG